jgi:L-arabinonolactonase
LIADPEAQVRRTRMNDGKVDRQGRFLAGAMDYEEREPLAGLYRLDPDLSVTQLETGIAVSNGPCWSPDGRTFYFADTWARRIWAYDYDTATGALLSRRIFADFEGHLRGFPDGATVDAEGGVWSVEVYGGRLVRFAPDGTIDRLVGMPVDSITSVMFGGAELDVLFVTSMARPFRGRRRQEREAGGLFAVHGLGVRGVPEPRFKG